MSIGTLALRGVVGGLVAAHGLQKLRGAFGGPGLAGTEQMMTSLEMHPAPIQARAAAIAETVGGFGIVAGLATPIAGAAVISTMVTAVRKVHLKNGPWNSSGGYEFNALIIAAVTAVIADGPGKLSFDAIAGKSKWGIGSAVVALGVAVAGSFAATEIALRLAPAAEPEEETLAELS